MKKSIIKNLIALTFALGALVFVAGNVLADEPISQTIDLPEFTITCKAKPKWGDVFNRCWLKEPPYNQPNPCTKWTGNMNDNCSW